VVFLAKQIQTPNANKSNAKHETNLSWCFPTAVKKTPKLRTPTKAMQKQKPTFAVGIFRPPRTPSQKCRKTQSKSPNLNKRRRIRRRNPQDHPNNPAFANYKPPTTHITNHQRSLNHRTHNLLPPALHQTTPSSSTTTEPRLARQEYSNGCSNTLVPSCKPLNGRDLSERERLGFPQGYASGRDPKGTSGPSIPVIQITCLYITEADFKPQLASKTRTNDRPAYDGTVSQTTAGYLSASAFVLLRP